MKHTCFFFLVLLFAACSASDDAPRSEQIRADLLNPDCQRVLVASHRADWRGWPENSIPAIESAIAMGVDIVELDLQCTADSQLIVMHDSKINRTTTGKGLVAEMTLDSIRTFRLKNGVNIRTRHEIPTLREVLLLCKYCSYVRDVYLSILIKQTGILIWLSLYFRKQAPPAKSS